MQYHVDMYFESILRATPQSTRESVPTRLTFPIASQETQATNTSGLHSK